MAGVLFFGHLSGEEAELPSIPTDSDAFRAQLAARIPALASPSVRMVVNQQMIRQPIMVGPDDEIAFLPPMSGG